MKDEPRDGNQVEKRETQVGITVLTGKHRDKTNIETGSSRTRKELHIGAWARTGFLTCLENVHMQYMANDQEK